MFGDLVSDPDGILDLRQGLRYRIIARRGEEMDDGLLVPALPDGMAAFPAEDGTVRIVCNHENGPGHQGRSAFGARQERLHLVDKSRVYDFGNGMTPGSGGTTTIHYDPRSGERRHMHLSLAGTEINCAGGATPWGSWLTCEETFTDPGTALERRGVVQREKPHGYIFEVPADADGLVEPVPLTAMGRFEHEAVAYDPATGIFYLTEDRHQSLFYRFIPAMPGNLREGGRLQALAVRGRPQFDSRNWNGRALNVGDTVETAWVDLPDGDVAVNDLRLRGQERGAALFARGEGICYGDRRFAFTCTIGGPERLGQVFVYQPGAGENRQGESREPGRLTLIAESGSDSLLRNGDNLTLSPWGDLIICEDTSAQCGLVALRPDGSMYPIAHNAYTRAELAGVCFSPDGATMFVNLQQNHMTLAITGSWPAPRG